MTLIFLQLKKTRASTGAWLGITLWAETSFRPSWSPWHPHVPRSTPWPKPIES